MKNSKNMVKLSSCDDWGNLPLIILETDHGKFSSFFGIGFVLNISGLGIRCLFAGYQPLYVSAFSHYEMTKISIIDYIGKGGSVVPRK